MKVDFPELAEAVFAALHSRGYSDDQIVESLSASPTRFKALQTGRHQLTDREMAKLEDLSDRTIGQLGMEGFGIADPSLRKVMDAGVSLREATKKKSSPRRKQGA